MHHRQRGRQDRGAGGEQRPDPGPALLITIAGGGVAADLVARALRQRGIRAEDVAGEWIIRCGAEDARRDGRVVWVRDELDALNLGWKLALVAGGRAGEKLLDSYPLERGLGTEHLRRSPLTEQRGGPPPVAGDPVRPYLDRIGVRLPALGDGGFQVLVGATVLPDSLTGRFAERYGDIVRPTLLPAFTGLALIRPDGFVSYRSRDLEQRFLLRHLTRRLQLASGS